MTSATERLRALLDERGVEWMDDSYAQLWSTVWHGRDGKQWRLTENRSGMLTELKAWQATPEQAIDATLGPGTCHAVFEVDAMSEDERVGEYVCSECGETFNDGHGEFPHYCPGCGRVVVDA